MDLANITPIKRKMIQVVVETPKGSQNKYSYEERLGIFCLKKTLPTGMAFPFDFGFVPNTKGGDGDPLDVLILMDAAAWPGCLVACRPIGVLIATQREQDGKPFRNDRIIAVASSSRMFAGLKGLRQLGRKMSSEISGFFEDYNKRDGKRFTPERFADARHALSLIRRATVR